MVYASYPCIIKYYPEYEGLNELKNNLFNLKIRNQWTKEKVIDEAKDLYKKWKNNFKRFDFKK